MRILLVIVILICFVVTPLQAAEIKGTPDELNLTVSAKPRISMITGEGEIKTQTDQVILRLKVMTKDQHLRKAIEKNRDLRTKMVDQLTQAGLPRENITVSHFSWMPEMGLFGDKVKKYRISHQVKITLADEEQFIHCAALIDKHNEIEYAGLSYQHSNKEQMKLQALEKASQNAAKKKEIYDNAFGTKLKVVRVIEQNVTDIQPRRGRYAHYESPKEATRSVSTSFQDPTMIQMDEQESSVSDVPFGQIIYRAAIQVECQY
jgi:uncharacterized protein YggE